MLQSANLRLYIHQAICVLGECIHPQFSETPLKVPMFHNHQAQPLYTSILLGACARYWPELQHQLYALGDDPEKPVTLQNILDVIVVFESSQARYWRIPQEKNHESAQEALSFHASLMGSHMRAN